VGDELSAYRRRRSASRTPEPMPAEGPVPRGHDDLFVIQEHHARRLHWDLRLERGGVLVSWALPKGLPTDPRTNHLAIQTENHPLDYATFEGEIPPGEYGAGRVEIWDQGTYDCEEWTDREIEVVLHGHRVQGRYVLIHTDGNRWLIHRMDPPVTPDTVEGGEPMPTLVRPMLATLGELPPASEDAGFGYEMKWDGARAVVYADSDQVRIVSRNDREITASFPELHGLGDALRAHRVVLDGEIVAFASATGQVSFAALQSRLHVQNATRIQRLTQQVPVAYYAFDVLYRDGHMTLGLPYRERRRLLESLELPGPHWDTPPYVAGGGPEALAESRRRGLEGVLAKRLTSIYEPGRRSKNWIKVKHQLMQEVVIGGWQPGKGRRTETIGALLLGIPGPRGLDYVGKVGTGFNREILDDLLARLRALERETSPFADDPPTRDAKDAHWVNPDLVGEVAFTEWTRDGRLRHPTWRGLRLDKSPPEVVRES
jgi:bifunctional non-homologous end joining protein LigD